ncbi:MAG: SDR family NAD(P)-dependent oxidoreductase [Acidimicrobiales bacterium]
MSLEGSRVLVTGSTSGIGEAIAMRLASDGADTVVTGRDGGRGREVVERIHDKTGRRPVFIAADLSTPEGPLALAAAAEDHLGGVDVLVNNAGVYTFAPSPAIGTETFDAMFSLNVRGAYLLATALLPQMAGRGRGAVVNITTAAAYRGFAGAAAYGASKAALDLFTKAWAAEFGRFGVHVNAVSPGPVHTPGTAGGAEALDRLAQGFVAGRACTAEEVAGAVSFLCGPESSYIHGTTLHVDGGAVAVLA